MNLNRQLQEALREVATLGPTTTRLISKLPAAMISVASTPAEAMSAEAILRARIQDLESENGQLRAALDEAQDSPITDVQAASFKTEFSAKLGDIKPVFMLAYYDTSYFLGLSRSLRPLVAQCLLARAEDINMTTPQLWSTLAFSDGAMEHV